MTRRLRLGAAALIAILSLSLVDPACRAALAPPPPPAAAAGPTPDEASDRGWPRQFETATHEVRIHQPQVDDWRGFDRIRFRAAVVVAPKGSDDRVFGALVVSARADVAFEQRLVMLTERRVESLTFPGVDPKRAEAASRAVLEAMPQERPLTISLDRLVAEIDPAMLDIRKAEVSLTPPKILASDRPAVMVTFLGKPKFTAAPGADLMVAVNTNWDVFLDPADHKYYLLHGESWLTSDDLAGKPWTPAARLPAGLSRLPRDPNWEDVLAAVPGKPLAVAPAVFVTNEPTELIVTEGAPEMEPIPGTRLMMVANTESDLFFSTEQKRYYLLASGRWFRAPALAGPWESASASLPDDFRKIPEDSEAGDVLASVPGTAAAKEAAILASLPHRATVDVAQLTVNVTYDGAPVFRPIAQTTVQYAYNTPYNVFLVDGRYYCCHNAVWFSAPTPAGAWAVASSIPAAIYTIPPSSPKHSVTYVTIYESTPTTVTTCYTSGYTGAQVAATGVVMFGLGVAVGAILADDDPCWHYHYHSAFFSYGCGAHWHAGHGGFIAVGGRYGPYGGCGGFAAFNPATGVISRGAFAYGPRGAAGIRTAYNPSSGVFGYKAEATTPFGSWSRTAISNGDDWVRAGSRTGPRGTVRGVEGSGGAGVVHAEGRFGNGVTVARSRDGDILVGKDGNVYRRNGGEFEPADRRDATPAPRQDDNRPPTTTAKPSTQPATQPAARGKDQADYLKSQSESRDRGDSNLRRSKDEPAKAKGKSRTGRRP